MDDRWWYAESNHTEAHISTQEATRGGIRGLGQEQSPIDDVTANVKKASTAVLSTHIDTTASYIARSLDPEWNEHVEVDDYQTSDELEFHVMDYDYLTKDDWLCTGTTSDADLAKRKFYRTLALGDDKEHGASGKLVKGKLTVMRGSPGMAR